MMGFGSSGNGGSSSSSSNLSALAPPFTVDRSITKPISNPLVHLTEPPYAVPFKSSLHNWQYPHSSTSRPDFFSNRDSEVDSIRTTSLPSANDYGYAGSEPINLPSTHWPPPNPSAKTATDAISYLAEPKPYYPPYVSPVVKDDTPLVALSEPSYDLLSTSGLVPMDVSSQVDYTQSLSGLEYTPQWGGFWNGLAEGTQGKRIELDGSLCSEKANVNGSLVYKYYMKQAACTPESLSKREEDTAISHGKCIDVFGRENRTGSSSTGLLDDKSFLPKNFRLIPVESPRMPILGTSSILPESLPHAPPLDLSANSCNHQKPYSPFEKCFQPLDSFMNDCIAVTKSSPALVIRPPSVSTTSAAQNTVSSKTVDFGNIAAANCENVDGHNPSKGPPHLPLSSEGKEDCLDTSQLSFHIERNDPHIFVAPSLTKEEELSDELLKDALNFMFKARSEFHPDINVPGCVSLADDVAEAIKSTENSSENLDHHNPAEDSPCWKGAPASHFSAFDVFEAVTPQNLVRKSEACNGLNLQGTQIFPPYNDSVKTTSRKLCENIMHNENVCVDDGLSLSSNRTSDANCPAKENRSCDAAKPGFDCPKLSCNKGVQFSNDIDKLRKEYELPNESKSVPDPKPSHTKQLNLKEGDFTSKRKFKLRAGVVDAGMNTIDALDGHCVPLLAMENVSCSHSSGEDAAKVVKPHGRESTPKMNVQMIVNAMHNLSELLLFHGANDECALREQDREALKRVIGNLDACMSKKFVHMTPTLESTFPKQETSHKFGEFSDLQKGASAGRAQVTNEAAANSHGQLDCQRVHEEKSDSNVSGKKVEKFQDFVSIRDDTDIMKEDKMVQALKKVLDENFHGEEEMQPQTLLYKNLWLEAEAELCSISFRARFDRMKIQMEKCKSDKAKDVSENNAVVEKLSSSNASPDPNISDTLTTEAKDGSIPNITVQDSPVSSTTPYVDDVEASVMTRFHILRSRGDNSYPINMEEQQLPEEDDAGFVGKKNHHAFIGDKSEASVMTRFLILRSRSDNSNPISMEEQQLPEEDDAGFVGKKNHHAFIGDKSDDIILDLAVVPQLQHHTSNGNEDEFGSYIDGSIHETVREFHVCDTDDPVTQSSMSNGLWNHLPSGWYDSSSSDWEHVLKDEFVWRTDIPQFKM